MLCNVGRITLDMALRNYKSIFHFPRDAGHCERCDYNSNVPTSAENTSQF